MMTMMLMLAEPGPIDRRATTMSGTRGRGRELLARVSGDVTTGYDGCSADSVGVEVRRRLNDYMTFMNDPALNTPERIAAGYPETRATWPAADGSPTDAQSSPLAHRRFFDWQVRSSGGRSASGAECMDVGALRNLLSAIGMDLTVSCVGTSHDVAEGIAHGMDKGGDDDCVTWPEYLNSMFGIGPVADVPTTDPTESATGGARLLRIPASITGPRAPSKPGLLRITLPKQRTSGGDPPMSTGAKIAIGAGVVAAGLIAWKVIL